MDRKTENWERERDDRKRRALKEQEPEDWEREEGWEDAPEGIPVRKGTVIAVFCGLIVLAAVICGILWHLTHGGRKDNGGESSAGKGSMSIAEESQKSGIEDAAGEPSGSGVDSGGTAPGSGEDSGGTAPGSGEDSGGTTSGSGEDSGGTTSGSGGDGGGTALGSGEDSGGTTSGSGEDSGGTASGSGEDSGGTTSGSGEDSGGTTPGDGSSSVSTDPNRVSTLDGRVIVFTDCDDTVTPKIYVNLRSEPSTTEGDSTVLEQISAGTWVHRTGISEDSGWSRIEKDGTVCYVVTSYVVLAGVESE